MTSDCVLIISRRCKIICRSLGLAASTFGFEFTTSVTEVQRIFMKQVSQKNIKFHSKKLKEYFNEEKFKKLIIIVGY